MNSVASARFSAVVFVFVSILLLPSILVVKPAGATDGPRTQSLMVHVYGTYFGEADAFANSTYENTLDFMDSPPLFNHIRRWERSPYPEFIRSKNYRDNGVFEIDINNQRWPTGVTEPRIFDPATGTYKHYYGTNEPWDTLAREFRKAIAYLGNKDMWITDILRGYGRRIDTIVPWALAGYTDYNSLRELGSIYDYDPSAAAAILNAAGFTQGSTPNPYYDPGTPDSALYIRTDPRYGGDMQPLVFYICMEDILRRDIGRNLTLELRRAGIPVNAIETARTVIYTQVMQLYDYNLCTEGWGLQSDIPDALHFQFHSSQYVGGSSTSYYGGSGYSPNYVGFSDSVYDSWAEQARNAESFDSAKIASLRTQERMAELVGVIPVFSYEALKAFKYGWEGVVNMKGYGPDNRWTFLNAFNTLNTPQNPADDEIDWGICTTITGLNPVTSGLHPSLSPESYLCQDWKILDLMYDSLICPDPYDSSKDFGLAAQSWTFNPTDTPYPSATFTLRPGLLFHDDYPVTPEDVQFSLEFQRACGPTVAWAYDEVQPIVDVQTYSENPELGPLDVRVYFSDPSYWAMRWAGYRPILNKNVWMEANAALGWGYVIGMNDPNVFINSWMVRNYVPWLVDTDGDGITDFEEDGSGPWVFNSYTPVGPISAATSIYFQAFNNYAISQNGISDYVIWSLSQIGDVDQDGDVDSVDGLAIQRALGTDTTSIFGTDWDQYNQDADIYTGAWDMIANAPSIQGDGIINYLDMAKWAMNSGREP